MAVTRICGFAVAAVFVACSARSAPTPLPDEELVVYAAVLEQVLSRPLSAGIPVINVTRDYTGRAVVPPSAAERINARLTVRTETVSAFVSANTNRRTIPELPTSTPVRIVADTATGLRGRTLFSRVGFNADEALVEVSHTCGTRCGHVSYILLHKSDGRWLVTGSVALILF